MEEEKEMPLGLAFQMAMNEQAMARLVSELGKMTEEVKA